MHSSPAGTSLCLCDVQGEFSGLIGCILCNEENHSKSLAGGLCAVDSNRAQRKLTLSVQEPQPLCQWLSGVSVEWKSRAGEWAAGGGCGVGVRRQ